MTGVQTCALPISGVDQLYTKILEEAFSDIHPGNRQGYLHFQAIVGTILLIFNPLSINGLSELVGCNTHRIRSTVRSLHSLLLVPENTKDPISTFHKSFPDFLLDPDRCQDKQLCVEPAGHHAKILLACLRLMKKKLKKNLCNLGYGAFLSEVKDPKDTYIGDALEYTCQFWTRHLLCIPHSSPHVEKVEKAIDQFFTTHLLHWIEALALTGSLGVGVYAMNDIDQWCDLVSDMIGIH